MEKLDVKKFIDCVLYLNKMEISLKNNSLDTSEIIEIPEEKELIKLSDEDYLVFIHNLRRLNNQQLLVMRWDFNYSLHTPMEVLKNSLLNRMILKQK